MRCCACGLCAARRAAPPVTRHSHSRSHSGHGGARYLITSKPFPYRVMGQNVIKSPTSHQRFCAGEYPVSAGNLSNIQTTIRLRHEEWGSSEEKSRGVPPLATAKVADAVIGWFLVYFDEIGDLVGCLAEGHNDETLIIPRMEKKLVYKEYQASEGEEEAASKGYFMSLWGTSKELSHVEMARKVRNFQLCTTCHTISEGISKAHKSH